MTGCVAGYAKHHYYLGTPEEKRTVQKDGKLYEAKKKWVKTIRPRRKKYPMIVRTPK